MLARLVAGNGGAVRARRWAAWPLLAAMTLWAPAWAATLCMPAQDALSGAGAGLAPAARALAAAVPAAFGEAGCQGLVCLARVSACCCAQWVFDGGPAQDTFAPGRSRSWEMM